MMSDTDYVTENDDMNENEDVNMFFKEYMMSQMEIDLMDFSDS